MVNKGPIGVFDSGYGGLTILKEFTTLLPDYDYLYLGDNARSPYGTRSFETVYQYTLQCVELLYEHGCRLIILACNTASAKALRTIQQRDMHRFEEGTRVLGIIRPTSEVIGNYSKTKQIGILGTAGTVQSGSYLIEIQKFFPDVKVYQQACPMWVPIVENNEYLEDGADYFVKKNLNGLLDMAHDIDTILLACTHYPLLLNKINQYVPDKIKIISQGPIVAESLQAYLNHHPEIDEKCLRNGLREFYTTDSTEIFNFQAGIFFGQKINSHNPSILF